MNNNFVKISCVLFLVLISGIIIYVLSTKWEAGINESICKEVEDVEEKGECFYDLAIIKGDEVFCREIKDSSKKENCHYGVAVKINDLNICSRTGSKETECFRQILAKFSDKDLCETIENKFLKEDCYYHLAVVNKNLDLCSKSGNNENNCRIETKRGETKEEGLIAYWNFDEGQGSFVNNFLNSEFRGTIYGAKWIEGISGKALEFDGQNDYVQFNSPVLYGSSLYNSSYSVCAWVKPKSIIEGLNRYIIANGGESSLYSGFYMNIEWSENRNGQYVFGISTKEGVNGKVGSSFSAFYSAYDWTFLCGTWNGSENSGASMVRLYLNGNLVKEGGSFISPSKKGSFQNLRIGCPVGTTNYSFYGAIDEVKIYNKVLTDEEIRNLYSVNSGNIKRTEKYIRVISPNGGEIINKGTTNLIRWEYYGVDRFKIKIINNFDSTENTQLLSDYNSRGTFQWTIPFNLGQGKNWTQNRYKIIIEDSEDPSVRDISDNYFTIIEGEKCTDSDNGKDYYQRGTVSYQGGKLTDRCELNKETDTYNILREYYCFSDYSVSSVTVKCSNGCNSGECFGTATLINPKF